MFTPCSGVIRERWRRRRELLVTTGARYEWVCECLIPCMWVETMAGARATDRGRTRGNVRYSQTKCLAFGGGARGGRWAFVQGRRGHDGRHSLDSQLRA